MANLIGCRLCAKHDLRTDEGYQAGVAWHLRTMANTSVPSCEFGAHHLINRTCYDATYTDTAKSSRPHEVHLPSKYLYFICGV